MDEDLIRSALQFSPHIDGNKRKKKKNKSDVNKLSLKTRKQQQQQPPPPRRLTRQTTALAESTSHNSPEQEISERHNSSSGIRNVCPTCHSYMGKENLQSCQCADLISSDESSPKNPTQQEAYLISQLISEDESEGKTCKSSSTTGTYQTCLTSQQPRRQQILESEDEIENLHHSFQSFSLITPEKSSVSEAINNSYEKVNRWLKRLSLTPETSLTSRRRHISESSNSSIDDGASSSLYPSTRATGNSPDHSSCHGTSMQSSSCALISPSGSVFSRNHTRSSRNSCNNQSPVNSPRVPSTQPSSQSSDNDVFKIPNRLSRERSSFVSSVATSQATTAGSSSSSQYFVDCPPWSKNKIPPKPKKKPPTQSYSNSSTSELSDIGELDESIIVQTPPCTNTRNVIPSTPSSGEESFHLVFNSTQPTEDTTLNESGDSSVPDTVPALSDNCSSFASSLPYRAPLLTKPPSQVASDSGSVADTIPWSESNFAHLGPPIPSVSSSINSFSNQIDFDSPKLTEQLTKPPSQVASDLESVADTIPWSESNFAHLGPPIPSVSSSVNSFYNQIDFGSPKVTEQNSGISIASSVPSTIAWPSDCSSPPLRPRRPPYRKAPAKSFSPSIASSAVFSNSIDCETQMSMRNTTSSQQKSNGHVDFSIIEISDDESTKISDSDSDSQSESSYKIARRRSTRLSYVQIVSSASEDEIDEPSVKRNIIPESDSEYDSDIIPESESENDEVQMRRNRRPVGAIGSAPVRKESSQEEEEEEQAGVSQETHFLIQQSQSFLDFPQPEISEDEDEEDAAKKLDFDSSSSDSDDGPIRGQTESPEVYSRTSRKSLESPVATPPRPRRLRTISSESSDNDEKLNRFFETEREKKKRILRHSTAKDYADNFIVNDSYEENDDNSEKEHSPTFYHKIENETERGDLTWLPDKNPKKTVQVQVPRVAPKTTGRVAPKPLYLKTTQISPVLSFLASLSAPDHLRRHPEAVPFFKRFNVTKHKLTKVLYDMFNDGVFDNQLDANMQIKWNNRLSSTAGFCTNQGNIQGGSRSSSIMLSGKLLVEPGRLRDTLIHEMCHAAVWVIDGNVGGHGPKWRYWTKKARKMFPELPEITVCHSYRIEAKFTYKCTQCDYSFGRHSKSVDISRKVCGICRGRFELLRNGDLVSADTPSRPPNVFAVFVKTHYSTVKANRKSLKHGDVMKILSQRYKEQKITEQSARK